MDMHLGHPHHGHGCQELPELLIREGAGAVREVKKDVAGGDQVQHSFAARRESREGVQT